jgi:hypothetical protein
MAWSFVRDDQPRTDTARQVALALHDDARDLAAAGIRIMSMSPRCASCCRRCGKRTNRPTWTALAHLVAAVRAGPSRTRLGLRRQRDLQAHRAANIEPGGGRPAEVA